MLSLFSKLRRDRTANVLVLTAFGMPLVIGGAGLGMDTIQWTVTQRKLQRMADSAALAGAYAVSQGGNARTEAQASLTRDSLVSMTTTPVIENAPTGGSYSGNNAAVRVMLATRLSLPFSGMFLPQAPNLQARSTAAAVTNGEYCVISLESTNTTGISLSGSSVVNLGCGMASNSPASSAISAGGSSTITASPIAAVGGVPSSSSYASGTVLQPHTMPQPDPYSSLPIDLPNNCSQSLTTSPNTVTNVTVPGNGYKCFRGMNLKGTVNFEPGTYYVDGGNFTINSNAVITGTGVTFVLTSSTAASNPNSIPQISMNGNATIQLSAPDSGTYAGVLFYQDRRANNSDGNTINGDSGSSFEGAFYLPAQGVSFSGNSGMATECVQIVSRRVTFTGNTNIANHCDTNPATHAFAGTRIFLVE